MKKEHFNLLLKKLENKDDWYIRLNYHTVSNKNRVIEILNVDSFSQSFFAVVRIGYALSIEIELTFIQKFILYYKCRKFRKKEIAVYDKERDEKILKVLS